MRADWLSGRQGIKGRVDSMPVHLWVGARKDDMTDWEPDN